MDKDKDPMAPAIEANVQWAIRNGMTPPSWLMDYASPPTTPAQPQEDHPTAAPEQTPDAPSQPSEAPRHDEAELEQILKNHPGLTREEAIRFLEAFGG